MGTSLKVGRRTLRIAFALAALLCLPAVGAAQTGNLVTIRVASSADDAVTPILYAQREGLFRRAGLDVVLEKANSGSAVAAAVISGAADIGKSSLLPLISAHAHGIGFILVGGAVLHLASSPDVGLIAAANGAVRSIRDLDGQVVSVPGLNDVLWIATRAWIDSKGGDSSTVRFVELPGSAVAAALEQGRIVAGALTEPYMTSAATSGKSRILGDVLDGVASRLLESAWFANADFSFKNGDAIARFGRILREASLYCNEHQSETVDLVAAFTGIEPATFKQMHRPIFATALEAKDIQPLIDVAAKYKVIPAAFAARDLHLR
ncbi:MAG TPA: ABC transporter substrate-binding protein [Candidatus Acidoferrales bacterium]|nr:ABC transporter substrate-binding protein [Candidatus Acidoferrales bacterium]